MSRPSPSGLPMMNSPAGTKTMPSGAPTAVGVACTLGVMDLVGVTVAVVGIEVAVVNGLVPDRLTDALKGNEFIGTRVKGD